MKKGIIGMSFIVMVFVIGCEQTTDNKAITDVQNGDSLIESSALKEKVCEFVKVKLTTDLSVLTPKEKEMLPILVQIADIMNELFWLQAYGDKEQLINSINDEASREFVKINYGPWERLNGNVPFIEGYGEKPKGAGFYPVDMTKAEFEGLEAVDKTSLYTLIQRMSDGQLISVPYHVAYKEKVELAASLLEKASLLAEDEGLKKYLNVRAKALITDDYYESDVAWMNMKSNTIDFVVGPIENYEDALYGYKAAYESFILIKDKKWSHLLDKYAAMLPDFQKGLPVDQVYKNEMPGSDSDLGAYDVLYYAGDCNAGSKTIAINLPNDEKVRMDKGSRKLQLKNSMRAKFDKILVPISKVLIAEDQRKHIKFDAFFENTMFHEVAHGLGLGNTIDGKMTVREALKEQYTALEEGKADILGLYIVTKLYEMGELNSGELMDNYVTFLAGIFRSVRFGASSSHGKANMLRFYYFEEAGAFTRDPATGLYRADFEKMKLAMALLTKEILVIQGNGNYEAAKEFIAKLGYVREDLQKDLDRVSQAGIPVDIVFEQGLEAMGLK